MKPHVRKEKKHGNRMKKQADSSRDKPQYPDETEGSRRAAKLREETAGLTDAEREELFKKGMQIIYGGSGNRKAVAGGR
jgi:hypothetical protein